MPIACLTVPRVCLAARESRTGARLTLTLMLVHCCQPHSRPKESALRRRSKTMDRHEAA